MPAPPVICIGSALWDIIASASAPMEQGGDIAGHIRRQLGGVALNVAVALARQGQQAILLSAIGNGADGDALIEALEGEGVDCRFVYRSDDPTDSYLAIENPDGDVFGAIADCASLELAGDHIFTPLLDGRLGAPDTPWPYRVVVDGNLPAALMQSLSARIEFSACQLNIVPASPGKAGRLRAALGGGDVTLYVNLGEAGILCETHPPDSEVAAHALRRLGAARAIVTDGPRMACFSDGKTTVTITPPPTTAHSTTGAGDVFMAAHIAAGGEGITPETRLQAAIDAAARHITRKIT
ncbi:MAG: PfkB family carbohydrate kinase [Rhodobacteraceae bacterium]|nr:PfkB family carbohydrate kinase [Paracoccaceae bacterium]